MKRRKLVSVLLLEGEALIALDVEYYLCRTGFEVAETFPSGASALVWLRANRVDIALLDIGLRDCECAELARDLGRLGIPFVVHSASRYDPETH